MKKTSMIIAAALALAGASAFADSSMSSTTTTTTSPMVTGNVDSSCLSCTNTLGAGSSSMTTTTTTTAPVVTTQTTFLTVGPGSFHGAVPGDYASNMAFHRWMALK